MIGSLGLAFINSAWGRYLAIALAALAALSFYGRMKRREGARKQHRKQVEFIREKTEDGREAFHTARAENAGRGVDALLSRMRSRDNAWKRLPRLR